MQNIVKMINMNDSDSIATNITHHAELYYIFSLIKLLIFIFKPFRTQAKIFYFSWTVVLVTWYSQSGIFPFLNDHIQSSYVT